MIDGRLLADIKHDESFRDSPYVDTVGCITIGYGTNLSEGISREVGEFILEYRLARMTRRLTMARPFIAELPPDVQRGILNMLYNLGLPRFLGFKRMLNALEAGDFALAADEALDSLWARQVGRRANRIADLIRKGE